MIETSAVLYQVQQEMDRHVELGGASLLPTLVPLAREEDEEVAFLALSVSSYIEPSFMSFLSPEAIGVYEGVWSTTRTEMLYIDDFVKGACSLSFVIVEEDRQVLADLLNTTIEAMVNYERYPALAWGLVGRALEVDLAILQNGETSNREHLMAYNLGAWFTAGHMQGMRREHEDDVFGAAWISKVLLHRAHRAQLEEF